jgi:hypothetical protein
MENVKTERNPFFNKLLVGTLGTALVLTTMTQCTNQRYLFNSGASKGNYQTQNPVNMRAVSPGKMNCTGPNCK